MVCDQKKQTVLGYLLLKALLCIHYSAKIVHFLSLVRKYVYEYMSLKLLTTIDMVSQILHIKLSIPNFF